jgi:hypothetical protein
LAHGWLDWRYLFLPGSGAPLRVRKLPRLRLGNSPDRRWKFRNIDPQAITPEQERAPSPWLPRLQLDELATFRVIVLRIVDTAAHRGATHGVRVVWPMLTTRGIRPLSFVSSFVMVCLCGKAVPQRLRAVTSVTDSSKRSE